MLLFIALCIRIYINKVKSTLDVTGPWAVQK